MLPASTQRRIGRVARARWCGTLLLLVVQGTRADPPYGLERRAPIGPFLDRKLPATPPVPSGGWVAVKAFPYLTFQDPVFITHAPRGRRLYVCGRQGLVEAFEDDPHTTTKAVVLDLRARCQ